MLMAKGISWGDPTAFQRDWFNEVVPQPHFGFDFVNWFGQAFDVLVPVHFFYFVLTIFLFYYATVLWSQRLNLNTHWVPPWVAALVIWGPVSALGSTTPLLGLALPHCLGASLLFLGSGALVQQRAGLVLISLGLILFAHVQHALHLAVLTVAFCVFGIIDEKFKRWRPAIIICCATLLIGIYLVSRWRLPGLSANIVELCKNHYRYHCYPKSWNVSKMLLQFIVFFGPIAMLLNSHRWHRNFTILIGIPALILLGGIGGDFFSIWPFPNLSKQLNIFRWITFLYPFTALAILSLSVNIHTFRNRFSFGMTLVILLWAFCWIEPVGRSHSQSPIQYFLNGKMFRDLRSHAALQAQLSTDTLIVAPPEWGWVRSAFHRGTIADFKCIPKVEAPLKEWSERTALLAGFFKNPSPEGFLDLKQRFQFTHLLWRTGTPFLFSQYCTEYLRMPLGIAPFHRESLTLYACN